MKSIYLDYNATAPMLPEVADSVREASLQFAGNPASQHEPGRRARRALEEARSRIGELLGAKVHGMDADRVVLTSGGSEANNLALLGLSTAEFSDAHSAPNRKQAMVVISQIEHPSVSQAAAYLGTLGAPVETIEVDSRGVARVDHLKLLLEERPASEPARLVSVTLANSETGVVQPVVAAAELCTGCGVAMHTDATQAAGKQAVDFRGLGVGALTLAAHKFNGPMGIGALLLRPEMALTPQLFGGFQQGGYRPGTETAALAVGMRTALEYWHRDAEARRRRLAELRDRLERGILAEFPGAVVIGADADRLPHTSNIALVGVDRQELAMALDIAGVACSTGSACASGSSEPSAVHVAMGLDQSVALSAMRFSLGATTTEAEIDDAVERILKACNRLQHGQ